MSATQRFSYSTIPATQLLNYLYYSTISTTELYLLFDKSATQQIYRSTISTPQLSLPINYLRNLCIHSKHISEKQCFTADRIVLNIGKVQKHATFVPLTVSHEIGN